MDTLSSLKDQLSQIKKRIYICKSEYVNVKRALTNVETSIIEAREQERRIVEQIQKIEAEIVDINSIDDQRFAEIEAFKERLPIVMRKIFWDNSYQYLIRTH